MIEPFIACICPAHQRPDFVARARACLDRQTYKNRAFVYLNTAGLHMTVGAIRNQMIRHLPPCDLIAHWDYDDWSGPTRLTEQVAFMQATGAEVVGYSDMPFYDAVHDRVLFYDSKNPHYALGTSLLYKRETWERMPFPDQTPEDTTWQNQVGTGKVRSCSSLRYNFTDPGNHIVPPIQIPGGKHIAPISPMMIQTVHGANAAAGAHLHSSRFSPASAELEAAVRAILTA